MTTTEVIEVAGIALTIVANAVVVGAAWGSMRTEIRGVKSLLAEDGEEGYVIRREISLLKRARDEQIGTLEGNVNHTRDIVDEHTATLATHAAEIAALK